MATPLMPWRLTGNIGLPDIRKPALAAAVLTCILALLIGSYRELPGTMADQRAYWQFTDELRRVSLELVADVRETASGEQSAFDLLQAKLARFDYLVGELRRTGLQRELAAVQRHWSGIAAATRDLQALQPRIVALHGDTGQLEQNLVPIQGQLVVVVDSLRRESASAATVTAAQKTLWLTERMVRNIDRVLKGRTDSDVAADELLEDAAEYERVVDALAKGNALLAVQAVSDPAALFSLQRAEELTRTPLAALEELTGAAEEFRRAAVARRTVEVASPELLAAIAELERVLAGDGDALRRGSAALLLLLGAVVVLIGVVLAFGYRSQRQRTGYTETGVAEIADALERIAEGDLTVAIPETNTVTRDIAREINASTERQRELIMNIRSPFQIAIEEINRIGRSARQQVEKGKELTRSLADSLVAATELVQGSEQIKAATAEAAQESRHNSEQVARGYELTRDMSEASVDVREAVQETSKSAKRQGELIQSVTAAAEYIQALNTKISIVAINTRIEAEKAGEYGRPFLGIAEAIGELLREAEEKGRKIIAEVRMLQNLSADNLASMENTVGNVVMILEYIERLDQSLEEVNAGSRAMAEIVNSVDASAERSAESARHMNRAMSRISERNLDISEYSDCTQLGVGNLQKSMGDVARNLSQFKVGESPLPAEL